METALHRTATLDLRQCAEYDALFSAVQTGAARAQYVVDTDVDVVFDTWVRELVDRRPLTPTPSAVACQLLRHNAWAIDGDTRAQFVDRIRKRNAALLLPVDPTRGIFLLSSARPVRCECRCMRLINTFEHAIRRVHNIVDRIAAA